MFVCLFHVSQPFVHFEVLTYIEVSCYHSATSDLLQTIDHSTKPQFLVVAMKKQSMFWSRAVQCSVTNQRKYHSA